MTRLGVAILNLALTGGGLSGAVQRPVPSHTAAMSVEAQNRFVAAQCAGCHSDAAKSGGLSLEHFDAASVDRNSEIPEKMIRKLRAGMMPPASARNRPADVALTALAAALEGRIDEAAALQPNPGRRLFQRLNRAEYARAIRDLLDLDVDVSLFLPADTMSHGFDNMADAQSFSPTLTDGYMRAANRIVTLALGDCAASPAESTYKVPRTRSQMQRADGAPWGTRGGISVVHAFPADGEYTFRIMLHSVPSGRLYASTARGEQIEVSIAGVRVALLEIDYRMSEAYPNGMNLVTPRIHVKAGPQRVSAAFLKRADGPVDDIVAPIDYTLADTQIGEFGYGVTTLPHLRDFSITGPFAVTGVSDTPSRRRIFSCRPTASDAEAKCAAQIFGRLATQAYRQPVANRELEPLMNFYAQGRAGGGFEDGIRIGLQAILVSPRFLFRLEEAPASVRPGQNYRIGDVDVASRLSFFLWGSGPDAALLKAARGGLRAPGALETQVRRMLADPRAAALSTRFAAQWLRLQDLDKIRPDALLFPSYDEILSESFKRETELLFDSIVREDRNVLDLLTADYTFVNERVAKHYRIPNVSGDKFRRVILGPALAYRRGLLGQGSMLMLTSVADRTSPVQRGKWIMEVLLGAPPPPPPPNVPMLEETRDVAEGGKRLSVRERMEEHRRNPACASCHRVIDPLGLALETFDVTGAWRIKDGGSAIDPKGVLYDGTPLNGPDDLRRALLSRSETVLRNFTENLMAYALGRRIEYFDQPTVRAVVKQAGVDGNRFSSYVLGIVASPAFQMSRAEPAGSAGR